MRIPENADRPATDGEVDDQTHNRGRLWPCVAISLLGAVSYYLCRARSRRRAGPGLPSLPFASRLHYTSLLSTPLAMVLGDRHARKLVVSALAVLAAVAASELSAISSVGIVAAQRLAASAVDGLLFVVLGAAMVRVLSVHHAFMALLLLDVARGAARISSVILDRHVLPEVNLVVALIAALLGAALWLWRRPPEPLSPKDPTEDPLIGPPLPARHAGTLVLLLGALLGLVDLGRRTLGQLAKPHYSTQKRGFNLGTCVMLSWGANVNLALTAQARRWSPRLLLVLCAAAAGLLMLIFAPPMVAITGRPWVFCVGETLLAVAGGLVLEISVAALLRQRLPAARYIFWYALLFGVSDVVKSAGFLPLSHTVALIGAGIVTLLLTGVLLRTTVDR